jgi:6-pyruvoyl-tetrahydropterin synthase
MVVDFKAIKLALTPVIEQFDHAMAIHADDPLRPHIDPNAVIVFEEQDPTTEVLAEYLFQCTRKILQDGWMGADSSGIVYQIDSGSVQLDRIRVWETPTSWAEFEDLGT